MSAVRGWITALLCGAALCCGTPDPSDRDAGGDLGGHDARLDTGGDAVIDAGGDATLGPDAAQDAAAQDAAPQDAAPQDAATADQGPPSFSLKAVATTTDPGFFSLWSFKPSNQLLAGTYGTGKIYGSSNGYAAPLANLNTGESIYVMRPFGTMLYANTENRGEIWRTPGGKSWTKVFNGANTAIGTGLAVHNGQLYAAYTTLSNNAGRIYRSSKGSSGTWSHVFGNSSQGTNVTLRELIVYKMVLYCLSYDWDGKIGGFYTTTNGTSWKWNPNPKLANQRPIKAHVWNGYLWISTSPYNGKRVPPASLYRWHGVPVEAQAGTVRSSAWSWPSRYLAQGFHPIHHL